MCLFWCISQIQLKIETFPMDSLLNLLSKNAIGLCITDENAICIEVNDEFLKIFGVEKIDVIPSSFINLATESQVKSFQKVFEKLKKHQDTNIEFSFQKSDGTIQVLGFASEWEAGEVSQKRLYITVRKVHFTKQMQLQLLDKEENQRADFLALINNMPDIVYSFDKDLRLINFNNEFANVSKEYFGKTPVIGGSVLELISHYDQKKLKEFIAKSTSSKYFSYEDKLTKNAVVTYYDVSINPIIKENGEQLGVSVFAKNITNRKKIETENIEKGVLLNTMIHSMNEGVALVNQLGELIICNESLSNMIGVTDRQSLITDWQNLYQFYDPIKKTPILLEESPLKQALQGISISNKEFMLKNSKLGEIYVICSAMPIRDHNGVVIAGMSVQYDITDIKLALKELQNSHERYEYVTKATYDAIWDLNLENDKIYWGEGFVRLFGHKTEGKNADIVVWYEHIHDDDRPRVLKSINTFIKGKGQNWAEEYRFEKANGEYAFVRNKGIVIRDSKGRGVRMIGAMQDISAQKKEELQLRLFKSVITNSTDVVLITEAEPIDLPGPKIVYVNEAFTKLTGYTSEEVIGKTPRILQGEKTNRAELDRLRLALQKWEPCEIEVVNYKKNGEIYWANLSIIPLANETGYFTHWISIQRDVTQIKNEIIEKDFFYDLIQTINSNEFLELSLSIAIEKISHFFGYTYAEAWLVNIDNTKMLYKANWSKNEQASLFRNIKPLEFSIRGNGVMGKAWEEERILYFDDINASEFLCKENAERAGLTCVLLVPIFYNGQVIAMFNFFSDIPFTFEQISSDLLNKISKQIGSNIQKSRTDDELNRFFNLSPDSLCIIGFDGYFKKINQAVSNVLGYTEKEMLKRNIASFIDLDQGSDFLFDLEKYFEGQSLVNYENRLITKSGKVIWVSWTAVPIPEEAVIFAVAKDITEKKQMELERENILDSISDCFYALDNDFNFTYINNPALILLKKSADELIGKCLFDIYPFLKFGIFYENFQRALIERVPIHFEILSQDLTNWYDTSFYPNSEGISVFFRSINDRKKHEQEILEANERYDLVGKATNDIIWDWNIITGEVYRTGDGLLNLIDTVNNLETGNNTFWQSRIHPEDLVVESARMKKLLDDPNKFQWTSSFRFQKPDGNYAYVSERGFITRNDQKEAIRMIGATRDITIQKESEILLKELNDKLKIRAEELANSNVELERFAYVASHDLQEPLRMVSSFLQLLQKKYETQLDETANKYINLAVDGSNRMKRLINDLLQFSRITSSAIALQPIDTNEILAELQELFKLKLVACNGTLMVDDLPIINADKTPMMQLLQNLISNALKYKSVDRNPVIKVSAVEGLLEWTFMVEDNGIGIDPKFYEKIFVIFQRLHNKDEYSGTGIGLAICKKIVERFNGKIWLESEVGKGTKFYFTIPK
jgi:PAS domain S-box-containing protein